MAFDEEEYLQLSGLQHFAFCRRQWALIHIEDQWAENFRTVDGHIMHEHVHDQGSRESRGDRLIVRGLSVHSAQLGISGQCDAVEFHRNPDGVALRGREGLWLPYPVEYKRGKPKEHSADELQLCAQAMCLEGVGASAYFGVFDQMILGDKETFFFRGRSRRPPMDATNALLSFAYSLLTHDCASALESVGLDSYVGFLHRDRPGRTSLALDLMEEMRPCMADRFVLSLINNRRVKAPDLQYMENGAVLLRDEGRKVFLKCWQERKKETLTHPYLEEKLPWGMIPYIQALLLARYLRGDLDVYPPFLWK